MIVTKPFSISRKTIGQAGPYEILASNQRILLIRYKTLVRRRLHKWSRSLPTLILGGICQVYVALTVKEFHILASNRHKPGESVISL